MCDSAYGECGILAIDVLRTDIQSCTERTNCAVNVSRSLLEKYMISASLVGRVDVVAGSDIFQDNSFELLFAKWMADSGNTDFEFQCCVSRTSLGTLSNALNWADRASKDKKLSLLLVVGRGEVIAILLGESSSISFDVQCKVTGTTNTTEQLGSLVTYFASKSTNQHFLRKCTDTHLLQLDHLLLESSREGGADEVLHYVPLLEESVIETSFREKYLLKVAQHLPSSPTTMWMDLIQLLVEHGEELSGQHLVLCSRTASRTTLQSVFFSDERSNTHPLFSLGHMQSVLRASLHAQHEQQGLSSECDSTIVHEETFSPTAHEGRSSVTVVITGISAALPGRDADVFTPGVNNIRRIINGECFITPIPDHVKEAMLEKNVVTQRKNAEGQLVSTPLTTHAQSINVSATLGQVNLARYGISESIISTMDRAVQVSIAAGLEALRDAGLVTGDVSGNASGASGTSGWELPEHMRSTTGVVYATSFPALDTAIAEVTKFFAAREVKSTAVSHLVAELRTRLMRNIPLGDTLSADTEAALLELEKVAVEAAQDEPKTEPYAFDRKFLFRVLVLGNAQLAQIIKARGPNMQTNAACAGATQAIALAYDMIQVGRAERVVVIAGDSASSDNLLPWLGNGFRILGAATTTSDLSLAAKPFGAARTGMILGSGGIGMVLESETAAWRRHPLPTAGDVGSSPARAPFKCRLLGTLLSNSAYHGASMDKVHIAEELERFVSGIEVEHGISRQELAAKGVYFSHETGTHASPATSCAANEIYALRKVFGPALSDLLILNTKGFTGHPMGVSFEDVVAVEVLTSGTVPPIANFTGADPYLGSDLKFSTGGVYAAQYALRFAAGFGSHIALALYGVA